MEYLKRIIENNKLNCVVKNSLDIETKKARSIRTGTMKYGGWEIGKDDGEIYNVEITKEELEKLAPKMDGLKIVWLHGEDKPQVGTILDTNMVQWGDYYVLEHNIEIINDKNTKGKELSLEYHCNFVVDEDGKIYQKDINPLQLSIVDFGRAGDICKIDNKKPNQKEPKDMEELEKIKLENQSLKEELKKFEEENKIKLENEKKELETIKVENEQLKAQLEKVELKEVKEKAELLLNKKIDNSATVEELKKECIKNQNPNIDLENIDINSAFAMINFEALKEEKSLKIENFSGANNIVDFTKAFEEKGDK